uniref:Uncharacterized protein n=1 Tax=Kalanchoe fedtschenkoi TaxID=63787 RepID=A0A7N0UMA8_KALFE
MLETWYPVCTVEMNDRHVLSSMFSLIPCCACVMQCFFSCFMSPLLRELSTQILLSSRFTTRTGHDLLGS